MRRTMLRQAAARLASAAALLAVLSGCVTVDGRKPEAPAAPGGSAPGGGARDEVPAGADPSGEEDGPSGHDDDRVQGSPSATASPERAERESEKDDTPEQPGRPDSEDHTDQTVPASPAPQPPGPAPSGPGAPPPVSSPTAPEPEPEPGEEEPDNPDPDPGESEGGPEELRYR
ncbi:hypothetical protein [Streptomyces otsuchiensis]|uniref:hypothetical protein n=1 Tax=Streptomyces otsuchiensis TaxID=2681388 RepID=UPI00102F4566|nr:hypothetical protein [Streptomyces otsuchiensis]